MAAAWACIRMMDQGREESSTPNGSLAAGLLLGVEGHIVSDMQPLSAVRRTPTSEYRTRIDGARKGSAAQASWVLVMAFLDRIVGDPLKRP